MIGSRYNAQALNPYSYVMNNPLSDSDPSGACHGFISCVFDVAVFGPIGLLRPLDSFNNHAFGQLEAPILAIAAAASFQFEVYPALVGAEFADLTVTEMVVDVALSGAIGGAINTGTLRGTLIGVATTEAFWGVGQVGGGVLGIPTGAPMSSWTAGQVAGMVALHAAVGCVSSAAGGGRCGSGALAGGLGEVVSGVAPSLSDNKFVQTAIVGLGGGAGSALTGGRFGDGFFIAASGYLFNSLAHDPNSFLQGANSSGAAAGDLSGNAGSGQPSLTGPSGLSSEQIAGVGGQLTDPSFDRKARGCLGRPLNRVVGACRLLMFSSAMATDTCWTRSQLAKKYYKTCRPLLT